MDRFAFDDDYVRRLNEGDRWTEEHFLAYFQKLLLIKLRSRLPSLDAVDEVRQEVFARVFRTLRSEGGLRDGRTLGAFVNGVCNNVLLERYRGAEKTEALDDAQHDIAADDVDALTLLATGEVRARVRKVLAELPPRDSALLTAVFFEERDKDQLCRELGIDRDYLRVLLHRARERFRELYEGQTISFRSRETIPAKTSLPH